MEWLRSSVFGGGCGSDEQRQQNSAAAAIDDEELASSSAPASPSPRLRKRNKRDGDGVNNNHEGDNVSDLFGRRLNFTSHGNTSDDDEDDDVDNNKSTDGSEEEDEDALNTTFDTVENPIVEGNSDDEDGNCNGVGRGEIVYVNDATERHHVQLDQDQENWRDMRFDPNKNQFCYKHGVDAPDGIPAADGYKIIYPTHADAQVRVLFNLSKDIIMASYEKEVEQLVTTFEKLGIPKTQEGISDYLFGAKSRLVQSLVRRLKHEPRNIHKFLATIYFAAELGLPSKRLQLHPNIKFDEYMDEKALNSFWSDIARIGKGGDEPTYLWQSVEDSLNGDCRDLFLSVGDQKYKLRVALDDDKVHFQFSTSSVIRDKTYLCGLSPHQHVKANRRGFTIDSAVSAATGFPLCFKARREGFSSVQNYEAMLRYMFEYKFSVAGAAALALNNIVFCSDRGYWQVAIILLILRFGGSVFGTLMRKEWVPFTYDQRHPGKRRVIEKRYGRCIFLAFGRWCNNMLKIMAYRSGTGSVSLAMDSDGNESAPQLWEFCFKNNGDAKWYKSTELSQHERNLKAFHSIDRIVVSKQEKWS